MIETIDPNKVTKDKTKTQFAPPQYLINYAKNYKVYFISQLIYIGITNQITKNE